MTTDFHIKIYGSGWVWLVNRILILPRYLVRVCPSLYYEFLKESLFDIFTFHFALLDVMLLSWEILCDFNCTCLNFCRTHAYSMLFLILAMAQYVWNTFLLPLHSSYYFCLKKRERLGTCQTFTKSRIFLSVKGFVKPWNPV